MIDGAQGRVLAVDDNRVNRLVLKKRLSQEGYQVNVVADGAQALEALGLDPNQAEGSLERQGGYDVVILDIMMPGVDGITVLRKIRQVKSPNELPVIMATAKDQSEDIVEALEAGCNDYVTKPIDMAVLLARVRTQISLRKTYQALREAQAALIAAAKMEAVGYLAAGVAHEVRNPLAQLQMGIEALGGSEAVRGDPKAAPLIEILTESVEKADAIVRRLMEVSRAQQLQLSPGSINKLVIEALEARAPAAEAAGVEVRLELDETVPQVPLARREMGRIFDNILANAIEATPRGAEVTVRTRSGGYQDEETSADSRSGMRLRAGEKVVVIEFTDSGPGIPPDKLQAVFDPFFTTKAPGEGVGLGLSLARSLVELHHGVITAENREDASGARLSVALPTTGSLRTSV
ncbi:MAG: response regulator [Verrucomicrobiales bacterium]